MFSFWKKLSLVNKLYLTVGLMAALIIAELITLRFAMHTLSAARAFVEGEGLWSKAQKNAAIHLQRYGMTHAEEDFAAFVRDFTVPEGDRAARLELAKPNPNFELVHQGFSKGRVDPADIPPMVDLLTRFATTPQLAPAMEAWVKGDELVIELERVGHLFHQAVLDDDRAAQRARLQEIARLDESLTAAEDRFSAVLGQASRELEWVVLCLLSVAVMLVEGFGLTLAFRISRAISRGLSELNEVAARIGRGDFSQTMVPQSSDEIGQLAGSLVQMRELLQRSYADLEGRVQERTAKLDELLAGIRFLDETTRLLSASLDQQTTLSTLAQLLVPRYANACAISLVDAAGHVSSIDQSDAPAGSGSQLVVPLVARARELGHLTLTRATAFTPDESHLLEELGRRAGMAIDNARLYREAREAVRTREDFLAVAGHELKTPLAALLLLVQGTARAVRKDSTVNVVDRLDRAERSGQRLERLINQVLDVSKISAGKLRLEPEAMDLGVLVNEIRDRLVEESVIDTSLLSVRCEGRVQGTWDRLRLDRVISNLVGNAVKYGQGKPIDLSVHVAGGHAVLTVVDRGIGIPPEQQHKIFDRFERAVTRRDFDGLGLGLWISQQIVEACGGTIAVSSELGQGSTFTVALPLQARLA